MNNELIPTNKLWCKSKEKFKNLFFKEPPYNINEINDIEEEQKNNNYIYDNNLRDKFEKENKKKALAEKLLYGELGTSELNETEVDGMIEYFTKDIQNINNEMLRIKQHILYMQKELKQME